MRLASSLKHAIAVAVLACACVGAAGLGAVDVTTAAYTDQATARTDTMGTATTRFVPQKTYIAGTGTALQDDGTIAIWGFRGNGLAGAAGRVADADRITLLTLPSDGHPDGARKAVKLAGTSNDNYSAENAGYTGLAALSDDGRVYTWGGNQWANVMGRTASPTPFHRPGQVAIDGSVVDLVSSSGVFMALTDTGDLWTWGNAQGRGITGQGQSLGTSSATPTRILTGVHSIGSGVWNGWAIRGDTVDGDSNTGVLWWGWANPAGSYAGSPSGDDVTRAVGRPTQSRALSAYTRQGCEQVGVVAGSEDDTCGITSLTGHYYGSQAILSDGTLLTWGSTADYGSGRATGSNATPLPAELPSGVGAVHVGTSEDTVMVLGSDGYVYHYGRNRWARGVDPATGQPSTTDIRVPTKMTALGRVVTTEGFGYNGIALRADGTLVLWGGTNAGGSNNPYRAVRNSFTSTGTSAGASQGLTELVMPGTERAQG